MTEYRVIPIELGADLFHKEKERQDKYRASKVRKKKAALDPFAAMFVGVGEFHYETDEDGQKHISFSA